MKIYSQLLILAIPTLSMVSAFAQEPNTKMDPKNLNTQFIAHLVKIKIDSVRIQNHQFALIEDEHLQKAAEHHANYLTKKSILSHFEKENDDMRTPYDRVYNFTHKLKLSVGENVMSSYVFVLTKSKNQKPHKAITYAQAANDIVIGWVNSPDHFKNIVHGTYTLTGVAIGFDKRSNELKAVQVFAEKY